MKDWLMVSGSMFLLGAGWLFVGYLVDKIGNWLFFD